MAPACSLREVRVDWRRVLLELRRQGYDVRRVATESGVSLYRVKRVLWRYSQPRYEDGARLLRLWAQATGNRADEPPMIAVAEMWE